MTGPEPQRFTTYTPRRISVFHRGYSVFVRVLKVVLPLVALVIVGLLIMRLSTDPNAPQQKITSSASPLEKTTPGEIELIAPKYQGMDAQGRPYTVTADKASRSVSAPDTVTFINPQADITLADGTWMAVKAESGALDHKTETMDLKGKVSAFHDSGYEMIMQGVQIDLRQSTAESANPVTVQGPQGTIAAQNISVRDAGDVIFFGGPATLTLYKLQGKTRG